MPGPNPKSVIRTGDMMQITPMPPLVCPSIAAPLPMIGSSKDMCEGVPICLQGDEQHKMLNAPIPYTSANFTIPGTLKCQIVVKPDNLSKKTQNGGKPILLKGTTFDAIFTVQVPAQQPNPPAPPVPDPVAVKKGTVMFQVSAVKTDVG